MENCSIKLGDLLEEIHKKHIQPVRKAVFLSIHQCTLLFYYYIYRLGEDLDMNPQKLAVLMSADENGESLLGLRSCPFPYMMKSIIQIEQSRSWEDKEDEVLR